MSLVDLSSYKTLKELRSFAETQQLLITKLMGDLKAREEDVSHLKKLLTDLGEKKIQVFDTAPREEELICIDQIGRLKKISDERLLNFKEVDSLEKLVRTLRSIRSPEKDKDKPPLPVLSKSELLELAAGPIDEPEDE